MPRVSSPPAPASRRARRRPHRHHWDRFAIAIGATVALVVVFGAGPFELSGGAARPEAAASVRAAETDPTADPSLVTTTSSTTTTSTTTTVPRTTTTTAPPTTTTEAPKLRVPGLGLPKQPAPQPVALPPTGSAPVFSRIPTTNKVIFLGIDDGMVRDPAVAELLKQANVPFTMFLQQGMAEEGADYFRQLQEYGGVVESHTVTHANLFTVSATQMQNEVCGTLDPYQNLFGRRPTLFRPPYGNTNSNVQAAAASCGYKAIVLWKGSTNDGRFDLQDGTQLTPGDVVLLHFRTDLATNLQKVFEVCKQQGFAIASLQDYLP